MPNFTHQLDSSVVIDATPADVFLFLTDPVRWALWWGAGSTIDARPGGTYLIRHPGGVEVIGNVVSLTPGERMELTYGYVLGTPIAVGESRVTIALAPVSGGTRVTVTHDFVDESARNQHVAGWRYQLSLFSNAVSDAINANATSIVDGWFAAWMVTDATARLAALSSVATADVCFRDRYANIAGVESLNAHIAAIHFHMPGVTLERTGAVRHCQGTGIVDWVMRGADGNEMGRGSNVLSFDATGKLKIVTGVAG
jgi:uncharacterized protein YndB with AHSA1/START domain